MQRRIEAHEDQGLWLERLVWNAAAGAALAVMILVLLGSLSLMDAAFSGGDVPEHAPAVSTRGAER